MGLRGGATYCPDPDLDRSKGIGSVVWIKTSKLFLLLLRLRTVFWFCSGGSSGTNRVQTTPADSREKLFLPATQREELQRPGEQTDPEPGQFYVLNKHNLIPGFNWTGQKSS